jgi:hypothetical protein
VRSVWPEGEPHQGQRAPWRQQPEQSEGDAKTTAEMGKVGHWDTDSAEGREPPSVCRKRGEGPPPMARWLLQGRIRRLVVLDRPFMG